MHNKFKVIIRIFADYILKFVKVYDMKEGDILFEPILH